MDQEAINKFRQQQSDDKKLREEKTEHQKEIRAQVEASVLGAKHIAQVIKDESAQARKSTQSVKIVDPIASPQDIENVVKALDDVVIGQTVAADDLTEKFKDISAGLLVLADEISNLPKALPQIEFPEAPETTKISNLSEIKPWLEQVSKAIASIDVRPEITVDSPNIQIPETQVNIDIDKIVKKLDEVVKATKSEPQKIIDLSKLENATKAVKDAINGLSFPVPNYVIPFKDINGAAVQVQLDADGNVPTAGSSNGLTDAQLRATPVPISGTVTTTPAVGAATEAKQDSQITLATQLETLTETLQELVQRLAPLAGAMGNTAQLRVIQTSVPSTAVTGPITSAQSIAEKAVAGISYPEKVAITNLTAIQSNINNAVAA